MAAAKHDIVIDQGSVFEIVFTYENPEGTPVDVTGYTARMHVRERANAPTTLLTAVSGSGGQITVGGAAGTFTVRIPATTTVALPAPMYAVYDFEILPAGAEASAIRLIGGIAAITAEVTR